MKKQLLSFLLVAYTTLSGQVTITMEKEAGVYKVPCVVNGAKMKFIFDTGAATVCLSESMAEYLLDNDYLSKEDFVGVGTSMVADGRTVNNLQVILKDIEIGGLHLKDVEASIVEGQRAPLLLGQTAIQKLGKVSIEGNKLTIDNGISDDVDFAIICLWRRCQYHGGMSDDITLEDFKEIIQDKKQLKSYYEYTRTYYSSLFEMTWDEFLTEINNLQRYGECKLVTKDEIFNEKWMSLREKAQKYEGQGQYLLAAETWEEYYKLNWGGNRSDSWSTWEGYSYSQQGEDAYNVGKNYYEAKEYNKAISWLTKSANKGYRDAQFLLGLMYSNGEGCEKNNSTAVYWYQKSAEQNHAGAQCNLGDCYVNGIGVNKNTEEGFLWTHNAYVNGSKEAEQNLYSYFQYYKSLAERGNTAAAFFVGYCYENGYGTKKNYYEAYKWFKESADTGDVDGMNHLAYLYYNGLGTTEDKVNAVFWWKKAAEQGDTFAQISLAQCYKNGVGIEQDYLKAFNWYMLAAEKDDVTAICELGKMLLYGHGVKADYTKAKAYFDKAAQKEYEEAYYILGNLYWQGFTVEQNYKTAIEWWTKCSNEYKRERGIYYLFFLARKEGKGVNKSPNHEQMWMKYCQDNPNGLNNLAYDLAIGQNGWKKQLSQVLAVINDAIKINPNDPNFYDSKGEFYSMQNNFEKAKEMWLKVKSINPDFYTKYDTELNKYINKQLNK